MRILTFTSLYPNLAQPNHGLFVEHRLRRLLAGHDIGAKVLAPVPWFPLKNSWCGKYARFAQVPSFEKRFCIDVYHPRYPVLPKIGMTISPYLMAFAMRGPVRWLMSQDDGFDLIDSHYFYPDGVAATKLGRWLNKPVIITARGSDINVISRFHYARQMMREAAKRAAAVVAVSEDLGEKLAQLGVERSKISVLRNGVDLDMFKPWDRAEVRRELRLRDRVLLTIGNLIELKGHHIAIAALRDLPDTTLVVVGEGPEESRLRKQARSLGVEGRVRFVGRVEQEKLPRYYSAADALVLASRSEGMANVLLESLACGTPVIATNVSGNPEVVTTPTTGVLMEARTSEALVAAYDALFAHYPRREKIREHAAQFEWHTTADGLASLFDDVLERWQRQSRVGRISWKSKRRRSRSANCA